MPNHQAAESALDASQAHLVSMRVSSSLSGGHGDAHCKRSIAHVVLGYQPNPIKMDLVIVQDSGKLLVDDELCTDGGPSTSIYVRTGGCGTAAD